MSSAEKKAAAILTGIAVLEGSWVILNLKANPGRFWRWMGLTQPEQAGVQGWVLALVVAAVYIRYAALLPSVRTNLTRISVLKLLALAVAFSSSLCEEGVFRKALMAA